MQRLETEDCQGQGESFLFRPTRSSTGMMSLMNNKEHNHFHEDFPHESTESRGSVSRGSVSSYADLLEASDVIIRDQYDGSMRSLPYNYNPVTANLQKCKRSMVYPYYKMLSLIAWRPFAKDAMKLQCFWSVINIIYPILIISLLFVWYIARVWTCQGMLSGNMPVPTIRPTTKRPITRPPHNLTNWSDIMTAMPVVNVSKVVLIIDETKPCYCQHVFGTYIVPDILYFLAYIIGFYHFRIQENEGLYALMEKVYLQSTSPQKITRTLRVFLYAGYLWLMFDTGLSVYFHYVFGLESTTGIADTNRMVQYSVAGLLVFAQLVADCVNVSVVINFGGQCQLLKCYLEGISQRLEEKTTELRYAMKDILDVNQNISRVNGLLSLNTSCAVFNMHLLSLVGIALLVTNKEHSQDLWIYRSLFVVLWSSILTFTLVQAARLTSQGYLLKERTLSIRVFGYQMHTQLDIDSFLNFLNLVNLEVKLFTIPVKAPYLWGVIVLATQIMILVFQSGSIVGKNKWI